MIAVLRIAFAMVLEALSHVTPGQLDAVKTLVIDFLSKLVNTPSLANDVVIAQLTTFDGNDPDHLG